MAADRQRYAGVDRLICAHPDEVRAVVAGFGALKAWIAGADYCRLFGDGAVGSVREISVEGYVVQERLDSLDDASRTLTYSVLPPYYLRATGVVEFVRLSESGPDTT
jgi:hypothetical protein